MNKDVFLVKKSLDKKFLNKKIKFLGSPLSNKFGGQIGRIFNVVCPCNDKDAIYNVRLDVVELKTGNRLKIYKSDNFIIVPKST